MYTGPHEVTVTDTLVTRNRAVYPGTVLRCTCGLYSAWPTRDGSAEAEAHDHRMMFDPKYRHDVDLRAAQRAQEIAEAHGAAPLAPMPAAIAAAMVATPNAPTPGPCHDCACHVNPPCGPCERCAHFDTDDCPNDCQTCEEDHDH